MHSYDYANRQGVLQITWDDFGALAAKLVELLSRYEPQVIVGIARGGLFPATAVACMSRHEMYPARLTRRVSDEVVYDNPVWKTPISADVALKVVAVVDEIADSGETLMMAAQAARIQGASRVITACLVSHSWAQPQPDVTALVSDALLVFPWDREVYMDGRWQTHPEIAQAIEGL